MANQSFDKRIEETPADDDREVAVILKAVMPGDPSVKIGGVDPVAEIMALADTAGLRVASAVLQKRDRPHPGTYVGRGKLEELKQEAERVGAHVILVDDPIFPAQGRNIEETTELRVVDRSELIMDIFARNARSHQAKIQIELAQLQYFQSRLTRMWTHLSRMEGGEVGTRGPGETQLETDRRIIGKKISVLRNRLVQIEKQAHTQHKSREGSFRIALVGYTNAGKSTLFNRLTKAKVKAEDKLFATLDPTMRAIETPSGKKAILSDTVGFISQLPHELVSAFQATLEEVVEADIIVHVRDAAHADRDAQKSDVLAVLRQLGFSQNIENSLIEVFNKADLLDPAERETLANQVARSNTPAVLLSAATGEGCETLTAAIDTRITENYRVVEVKLPHRPEPVRGLGIPEGVTLVVGGGYHGKSTVLRALERGVYPHIPGDGREGVVTRSDAVKIRAEDGRPATPARGSITIRRVPRLKAVWLVRP